LAFFAQISFMSWLQTNPGEKPFLLLAYAKFLLLSRLVKWGVNEKSRKKDIVIVASDSF
jgi:hypothetical protein